MLQIDCKGSPYEIGLQHGRQAKTQIMGSMKFYEDLFAKTAKLSWPQAVVEALKFMPLLEASWNPYVEEMNGVADGAGLPLGSILALNVRTEISMGLFGDGCTAFSWKAGDASYLAQNWDWEHEQGENIVCLHIAQPGKPVIHMMSEAGIIGKIGLNSAGVGVTLNAIRHRGVDFNKLPVHLALRTALESTTRQDAVRVLHQAGVAAACHIIVADPTGGIGLECSSGHITEQHMRDGITTHSNHFIDAHNDVTNSKPFWPDSPDRLIRVRQLLGEVGNQPRPDSLAAVLKDEKGYPRSINRAQNEKSTAETLFSIVMDLIGRTAKVKMGRPNVSGESFILKP